MNGSAPKTNLHSTPVDSEPQPLRLDAMPLDMMCRHILSNMWMDETNYRAVIYEHGIATEDMVSTEYKALFTAIHSLRMEGTPLEDASILLRAGANNTSITRIVQLAEQFDDFKKLPGHVKACCDAIKRNSYRTAIQRILEVGAREVVKTEQNPEDIASRIVAAINRTGVNSSLNTDNAVADSDAMAEFLASPPVRSLQSGIPWFDSLIGGIEDGQMVGIAGAYKARKTTFLENLILGLVMNGEACAFLSREMPKRTVLTHFITMLAVAWLKANGHFDVQIPFTGGTMPVHWISGLQLRQARSEYRKWHPLKVQAIDAAIAQYRRFGERLFILDSTPENGALRDAGSIDRAVNYLHGRYGIKRFAVDYLQLLAGGGSYEDVSSATATLQQTASSRKVTLLVAMQLNEAAIRDVGGYSPGIKGGGDPAQAVDYLIKTRYRQDDNDNGDMLQVEMALSRHGEGGGGTKKQLEIHRRSGLLLANTWIDDLTEQVERKEIDL